MKKHEEMREKANVYADVAQYLDGMFDEEVRMAENYANKERENNEDEFYKEQQEIRQYRAKIYKALYDMICKEVK